MIFFIGLFIAVLFIGALILAAASANAENKKKALATLAKQDQTRFDKNFTEHFIASTADWRFKSIAKVDGHYGFIAIDAAGTTVRLATFARDVATFTLIADNTLPVSAIRQLDIDQPQIAKTLTHNETVPVAVGNTRSSGKRALIGGLVAGEAGAIVGGMSGLGGKTKIQHVAVKRNETVYRKGHPTLILHVDDMDHPRRSITFDTVAETNDWSSRLHHAINR